MVNPKAKNAYYSILLIKDEKPALGKHLRGFALQENLTVKPHKLSGALKTIPHLMKIIPLDIGVYRCLSSDNEVWIVIDLDMV